MSSSAAAASTRLARRIWCSTVRTEVAEVTTDQNVSTCEYVVIVSAGAAARGEREEPRPARPPSP